MTSHIIIRRVILLRSLTKRVRQWLDELGHSENQQSLALSLLIGALVGLVVVAFILLTGRLAARMYPTGGSGWRRILVPTLGSLVTGYLLWRFFPLARGSGIPQTKAALFTNNGAISLRTVLGKFLCCSTSLASGIALGREGPAVHIGGGLGSVIARNAGLSREQVKALVPIGCSAALAAAFNTPIAAVLFSLEEIMGDLHATVLGTAVLSSATSWMVLHLVLGDDPLFHVAGYRLVSPWEFVAYAVLGIVGGLGSVSFVKLLLKIRLWFASFPASTVWLQPVAGGLTVGLMGYFVPEVMGVGYNYVERVLNGDVILQTVVLLAVLKIIATAVCYSSGNAGGIFGPALFIGSMMGAAVGSVAHHFFPASTAGPGAYALVGMGTAFAGIVRTPLTSVIMIFEVTRDYTIIVPLMISNLIAYFISYKLQKVSHLRSPGRAGRRASARRRRSCPARHRRSRHAHEHVHAWCGRHGFRISGQPEWRLFECVARGRPARTVRHDPARSAGAADCRRRANRRPGACRSASSGPAHRRFSARPSGSRPAPGIGTHRLKRHFRNSGGEPRQCAQAFRCSGVRRSAARLWGPEGIAE